MPEPKYWLLVLHQQRHRPVVVITVMVPFFAPYLDFDNQNINSTFFSENFILIHNYFVFSNLLVDIYDFHDFFTCTPLVSCTSINIKYSLIAVKMKFKEDS